MNGEIIQYEPRMDLSLARDPIAILEEAKRAAKALSSVIAQKPNAVVFNGEQYLEFEDWQTVGKFYGVTAKVVGTEFIDYGGVQGFLAKAVVININNGMEISAAESMCLNDEEKWSARTKYAFAYVLKSGGTSVDDPGPDEIIWEPNPGKAGKSRPKKERVKVGEEKVPLFQLRSMAQTRACAKALRNVLAWVVVLAGYRPTPAEEMTQENEAAHTQAASAPSTASAQPKPAAPAQQQTSAPANAISEAQAKRFFAIWRGRSEAGWNEQSVGQLLADHNIPNDRAIPKNHYDALVKKVQTLTFDEYREPQNA